MKAEQTDSNDSLSGHQGLEMYGQEADKPFAPHAGISGEETSWSSDARYVISGKANCITFVRRYAWPQLMHPIHGRVKRRTDSCMGRQPASVKRRST
jgi:hypothetical protein